MCQCKRSPGKFEGEGVSTFLLFEISLVGYIEDDVSYGDGAWAGLIARPIIDIDKDAKDAAKAYGYCSECIEWAIREMRADDGGGYSVGEDSNGFAWSQDWPNFKDAQAALEADRDEQDMVEEE
jgi:hypothetical protein